MHGLDDAFPHIAASGPIGLFELVRAKGPEAALAAASITERAAAQVGGRLAWAGHVDQILFGDVAAVPNEILVHIHPSKQQALAALAVRREWGLDALVEGIECAGYHPDGPLARTLVRGLFSMLRLGGRRTPVADLTAPDALDRTLVDHGDPSLRPSEAALLGCATAGIEGKVVMVNLLRHRRDAAGSATAGRRAHARYGRAVLPLIAGLGGRIRVRGRALRGPGAGPATEWDELVLVEYPSRADFVGMLTSPRYLPASDDRDAGLERSTLFICTSHATFF